LIGQEREKLISIPSKPVKHMAATKGRPLIMSSSRHARLRTTSVARSLHATRSQIACAADEGILNEFDRLECAVGLLGNRKREALQLPLFVIKSARMQRR
jgi:hypothetical protein